MKYKYQDNKSADRRCVRGICGPAACQNDASYLVAAADTFRHWDRGDSGWGIALHICPEHMPVDAIRRGSSDRIHTK